MKTSVYGLRILVQLSVLFSIAFPFEGWGYYIDDDRPIVNSYNRISEIENQCSAFLSSASELKPDDSRGDRLKNELSFSNGDWEQDTGGSPLMPYHDLPIPMMRTPLKLVSFIVIDVNPIHLLKNTASLTGIMSIRISRNTSVHHDLRSKFHSRPGSSVLAIVFEGVYIETDANGGEKLLCLLGNTTLPNWKQFNVPFDLEYSYGSNFKHEPRLLQDDQSLLVLRYPQSFNLTRRAIRGEMRSLNERGSIKYFDQVRISSQLGPYSKYQFSPERLKSRACDPYPYHDELIEDGVKMFDSCDFCKHFQHISSETFSVVPNWNFNGGYKHHSKLGPFLIEKEIKTVDWSYDDYRIVMHHVKCEQVNSGLDSSNTAKVSAVFRAIPEATDRYLAESMTGISGMVLTAEGLWNSSTGQLCMIGCLGMVDSGLEEGCDSQILLYFPRAFSIVQRSIILGSISSIKNGTDSYFPLLFQAIIPPTILEADHREYSYSYLSYNYHKTDLASAFRERSRPSKFESIIKRSLLKYPALECGGDVLSCLARLSNDLDIKAYSMPNLLSDSVIDRTFIRMKVLSLGPLFGDYSPWLLQDSSKEKTVSAEEKLGDSRLLNISLHFMFTKAPLEFVETPYRNISGLFLEGLYDTLVGEMYLIGCKKVIMGGSNTETERGQDCSIEVKIEYTAETLRWLINPTVKITITSQRNEDDPLHFSPISFQTVMIPSDRHYQNVVFRKTFEQLLQIVILLVEIAFILSQFFYINKKEDAIPYVSIMMLVIQDHEFSVHLAGGSEVLFKSKEAASYMVNPYDLQSYELMFEALDYTIKFLFLIVFLLIVRLLQKVSASRNNQQISRPSKPGHDKQVFWITLATHTCTYMVLIIVRDKLLQPKKDTITYSIQYGYYDFAHDLFLLPQIIGNFLSKVQVKPLRKLYYIGFTSIRILLHLYDYVRDPVSGPYSDKFELQVSDKFELEMLESASISKFNNIAAMVIMSMLTIVVYVQQRRNYQKLASH